MTSHPLFDADTEPPVLRLSSPQDLIRAVPYLLGFHPRDSLVMVGLSSGASAASATRVQVVARLDLDDVDDSVEAAESAVQALSRARSASVVVLVCAESLDDAVGWLRIIPGLEDQCVGAGLAVASWIFAGTDQWAIATHDGDDFVFAGPFEHDAGSVIPAAATYAGLVARPDRAALGDVLETWPADRRAALGIALDRHRRARLDCSVTIANRSRRADIRALYAATRTLAMVSDVDIVRFGSALADIAVRDACWLAIDGARIDGEDLWAALSRALPDEYRAPPLFLFGWLQWRAGRGALASVAVEEALRCDPTYHAADLLASALSRGLNPFHTPRLRKGA